MLSYRHAFHAGNAADVLKHSALIFCLDYLLQKEKPLLCVDTHAGAGRYSLREGYAAQNREWEQGIGKLSGEQTQLPPLLRRYIEFCLPDPQIYPGSPLIMAGLLRPGDRLVCCELHPADAAICRSVLPAHAELRQTDGFAGLRGLLPPPSRRGLVFIDPPYEIKDDYRRAAETLAMALKRFATGTYIVWYPLLRNAPAAAAGFPDLLMDLYRGNRCRAELYGPESDPAHSPRGMYGSGLVICNPPWTLPAALAESLPVIGKLIGAGERAWKLDTVAP